MTAKAYGAYAGDRILAAMNIVRRTPCAKNVKIDIAFCRICHPDIHKDAPNGTAACLLACLHLKSSDARRNGQLQQRFQKMHPLHEACKAFCAHLCETPSYVTLAECVTASL
jgi:hypothetical protein